MENTQNTSGYQLKPVPAILSIGYERRDLDTYLELLCEKKVTLLCDVRRNPISRKRGFSKNSLARGCEGVSIRYEHLPSLGVASVRRQNLKTQADYDALFEEYKHEILPPQLETLSQIQRWIDSGERVALTCYERMAHQCHRHCVVEKISQTFNGRIVVEHLGEDD